MTKIVKDTFVSAFSQVLLPIGFVRKGQCFYRIVNDEIVQAVRLQNSRLSKEFTININFQLVCYGGEIEYLAYGENRLKGWLNCQDDWWDSSDDSRVWQDMNNAFEDFKKIMYILEESKDARSYMTMMESQKMYYLDDAEIVYISLKLGDYNRALESIKDIEEEMNRWLISAKEFYSNMKKTYDETEDKERLRQNFARFDLIRKAILRNDEEYLKDFIQANEEYTRQNCIKVLGKKYKSVII